MQYLLDFEPFRMKDACGNQVPRSNFNVKHAARMFHCYVRPSENLLDAKLVITILPFSRFMHSPSIFSQ